MRAPRVGRLAERDLAVLDRLTVAGALGVLAIAAASQPALREDTVALGIWALSALLLLFRRAHPLLVQIAVLGCLGIVVIAVSPDAYFPMGVLVMLISNYSAGTFAPDLRGLWIAMLGNSAVFAASTPTDIIFPVAIFAILPWVVGATLRGNRERARELTERTEQAELETELVGQRAVLDERRRVARELHDVLAHDLSVIVIQAAAARRLIERSPETTVEAAELISRTGREAMAELRHLFGPVHREGEPAQTPGLAGVEGLVARSRAAGLDTELRIEGERRQLATGVDLAAFRVIQEALTNSLKHAGEGAGARVELAYAATELRLRVVDDGVGPGGSGTPAAPGGGHGLLGMRERVAVYGGELEAGRHRDGGFEVVAWLPLEPMPEGVRAMAATAGARVGETNQNAAGEEAGSPASVGASREASRITATDGRTPTP